jgi:capsular exopolysaccharide synthesis family protein
MIKDNESKSCMAEVYRVLRNNIEFAYNNFNVKSVLVTSARNGEGKTTVATNLAITMANSGKKVLLVDCNLNSPSLHKVFKVDNQVGLTTILNNEKYKGEVINKTSYYNLYLLTSGINSEKFAELLMSKKISDFFKAAKEKYDFIIVDSPAVMERSDAQIISQYVEGCILVIRAGQVNKEDAKQTKELLEKVNAKILGAVFNKTEERKKFDSNIKEYENVIVTEVDKVKEVQQGYRIRKSRRLRREKNTRSKNIFARFFTLFIAMIMLLTIQMWAGDVKDKNHKSVLAELQNVEKILQH